MKFFYLDRLKGSIKANLQNGRGGACTVYYNAFDPEVDMLARLKNPMTPATKQIRGMDYNMMANKFFGRKAARGEDVFLFNCHTAPDLYEAFYSGDLANFERLYAQYEADSNFKKVYAPAREIAVTVLNEGYETGRAYLAFADEINRHTPYKDPIYSSNLCVAPETLLLTDKGHVPIIALAGRSANVWNGEEWSQVEVCKTSDGSKLVKVQTSDGREVEVTPYHKWYVVRDYKGTVEEVRTHELQVGDKLIKMDAPFIEGSIPFERAYLNGFFTGDGTQMAGQSQRIDLFGDKRLLKDQFGEEFHWNENELKLHAYTSGLSAKHTVPHAQHLLSDRLAWLAGWLDADGAVYRNGDNESLVGSSSDMDFLKRVQNMLQTMGVNAKISKVREAGHRPMPVNDGTGNHANYWCKASYRLLISSGGTQDLLAAGLQLKRLKVEVRETQRRAEQFAVVVDVIDEGRIDETYCVTEPKRHMAVFNGILTGQCAEIVEPTRGYEAMLDLYHNGDVGYNKIRTEDGAEITLTASDAVMFTTGLYGSGLDVKVGDRYLDVHGNWHTAVEVLEFKHEPEVALCSLAALVITNIKNDEEYEKAMYYALLMIDICIHKSHYELPHIGHTAKARMAAAVGIMDLAHHMARKKLKYSTQAGKEEIHRVAERHMYFAIKCSLRLGKELGNAPWIHRTKYADGWTPMDTYQKSIDQIVQVPLQYDWVELSAEVKANKGIRNSSLVAYMPGESSSKASGTANSLYPVRELTIMKTDGNLTTFWAAPNSDKLGRFYEPAWSIPTKDMIEVYGIFQKFCDQAISADLYRKIEGSEKITTQEMLNDYFHMMRVGMKTRYYHNTHTARAVDMSTSDTAVGASTSDDTTAASEDWANAAAADENGVCESCSM